MGRGRGAAESDSGGTTQLGGCAVRCWVGVIRFFARLRVSGLESHMACIGEHGGTDGTCNEEDNIAVRRGTGAERAGEIYVCTKAGRVPRFAWMGLGRARS